MARGIAAWIAVALLGCLVAGAVYLPPRGLPKWAQGRGYAPPAPNQQRVRASELAGQWRIANAAVVRAERRAWIAPAVAARRAQGAPGPILAVDLPDSLRGWTVPLLQGALDSGWSALNLGMSKVSVGVLLANPRQLSRRPVALDQGGNRFGATYLLPDSSDRSTCLVVAQLPYFSVSRKYIPLPELIAWGAGVLGPCAYYARFGVPSRRVEQWLAARSFDVAIAPHWHRDSDREELFGWMWYGLGDRVWYWQGLYSYPRLTLACFSGRPDDCREGFSAMDHNGVGPKPQVVVPFDPWDNDKVMLIGSQAFLSDLLRVVGDERFEEFWTTSLPIDSALTLAVRQPVGQYTVSWLRKFSPAPRFGAATTVTDALIGLAFAVLLVAMAALGQSRREIQ